MPSLSPGQNDFSHVLPGAPFNGLQSITTFAYRWKRYIVYISGKQLNILRSATDLVQVMTFEEVLLSVRAEGTTGRFAIGTASATWILKPATTGRVIWTKEMLLNSKVCTQKRVLSWGAEGEILIGGGTELSLYNTLATSKVSSPVATITVEERYALWTKPTACPVQFIEFSSDSTLIATSGERDRLVKIWRRLSYEEAIFDHAYLPHTGIVTYIQWKITDRTNLRPEIDDNKSTEEACEILYTMSSDGMMRIWKTNGHHDLDILTLYTTIDLVSAIPHSPLLTTKGSKQRPPRYAFIIPATAYSAAVSTAMKKHTGDVKHAIEHLKEVASKEPDIIVCLDTQGRMSAWGVTSIGHKRRPSSDITTPFHVAHTESLGLSFKQGIPSSFETWFDGDVLNILAHNFGESVKWWSGTVENFSSSAAIDHDRGLQQADWQGDTDAITTIRQSGDTCELLSWTGSTISRWRLITAGMSLTMRVGVAPDVIDAADTQHGKRILFLSQHDVNLASMSSESITKVRSHPLRDVAELRLLRLEAMQSKHQHYLMYGSSGEYCIALVKSADGDCNPGEQDLEVTNDTHTLLSPEHMLQDASIVHCCVVTHPRKAGWLRVVAVDQQGVIYRQDISNISLIDGSQTAKESILSFVTEVSPSKLEATSSCVAILTSTNKSLAIIDLKDGYVEHQQTFKDIVQQLVFPTQQDVTEHSTLAILHSQCVDILVRGHYNHHQDRSQWSHVKNISIDNIGVQLKSIAWLNDGHLAICAGNIIFISNNIIPTDQLHLRQRQGLELQNEKSISVNALVHLMRSPLTCWQPHVLRQLITHGFFDAVVNILLQLQSKLKFYTNGDVLDSLLNLDLEEVLNRETGYEIDLSELCDQLSELDLPFTSDEDQRKLILLVQTVVFVLRHKKSLDMNAVRYLVHWRYHALLQEASQNGTADDLPKFAPFMHWREINFAYHSNTQQPLLDILVIHYDNKLDWSTVRSLGITLWLHTIKATQSESGNMASLEQIFDALGQTAFRATQPPNPADASLYLLALRKKAVLLSLWRVAVGNREQKNTQNFLRRDFNVEENTVAARKNAYALMAKRRFQYAAAFFLLADDPVSAISILAGQCEDIHLAVSIARAYCGDGSTVLHDFMQERIINSRGTVDRWQLSWACALTKDRQGMLRALIVDEKPQQNERNIKTWQQDDPATTTFYRELRDRPASNPQAQKEISSITTLDEHKAVLRSARILRRMGYWLLALNLTQHWPFLQPQSQQKDVPNGSQTQAIADQDGQQSSSLQDPPSMLDSFTTPTTDNNNTSTIIKNDAEDRAAKAAALLAKMRAKSAAKTSEASMEKSIDEKKPTQFNEPASSSILDSFGL